MVDEKDQIEIDLKIKAELMRLDQCHEKSKQEMAKLISKNKSESEAILDEIEAPMKLQEDACYERPKERLSRKSTMVDKDLDKLIGEEVGRWNEFMESFLFSRERTNVKSSTQIDSAKKSAHLDEFKKEENIGNKGSKTGVGGKDLKIVVDCDQLESRNMEESDQEIRLWSGAMVEGTRLKALDEQVKKMETKLGVLEDLPSRMEETQRETAEIKRMMKSMMEMMSSLQSQTTEGGSSSRIHQPDMGKGILPTPIHIDPQTPT
ncbi:unnamed protein product [Dovyalis caffra]|uniref:Uncharacterized protein n=1 Tax=Dovyalis caffra TaxID=77055 RepID=A0AAV1RES3_9ROSI|nr:unnamed protein product [Dovyalis caffra]